MRVLVTGGTGVVGESAVTELIRRGHTVRLLTRHAEEAAESWPRNVEPFAGDIGLQESITEAAAHCDAVLHVAGIVKEAPPEITFQKVNVDGTSHLIKEAEVRGVPRFVYVSSLGAGTGESAYHVSKREAEELVRAFRGNWTILQPGNVYGPGDEVISLLLKMVRTLPIMPVIGGGDQQFQPIWHEDLAVALADALERNDLAGQTVEVAGEEVTSMNDLLDKLAEVTGKNPPRLPVPHLLAAAGTKAMAAAGYPFPVDEAQLTMLREENVVKDSAGNALVHLFKVKATPLADGLRLLADQLPEQLPSEGMGDLKRKRFGVGIRKSPYTVEELMRLFRTQFSEIMPLEVSTEPVATTEITLGGSLTLDLPLRGTVQVRVIELTAKKLTLATLEGHPIAGIVIFNFSHEDDIVRFDITVYERAGGIFDLVALRTIGSVLQDANWIQVTNRVATLMGGEIVEPVHHDSETIADDEASDIEESIREIVFARKREEKKKIIDAGGEPEAGVRGPGSE